MDSVVVSEAAVRGYETAEAEAACDSAIHQCIYLINANVVFTLTHIYWSHHMVITLPDFR